MKLNKMIVFNLMKESYQIKENFDDDDGEIKVKISKKTSSIELNYLLIII